MIMAFPFQEKKTNSVERLVKVSLDNEFYLICRVKHCLYGLLHQDGMCRALSTVYSTMGNT